METTRLTELLDVIDLIEILRVLHVLIISLFAFVLSKVASVAGRFDPEGTTKSKRRKKVDDY
jgi:hypothetical protein